MSDRLPGIKDHGNPSHRDEPKSLTGKRGFKIMTHAGGTCGYFSFILSSQAFCPDGTARSRGIPEAGCTFMLFIRFSARWRNRRRSSRHPAVYAGGWMYFYVIYTVLLIPARMAELVDALVSNTSGSNTVPVRSRLRVQKRKKEIFDLDLPFFRFVSH